MNLALTVAHLGALQKLIAGLPVAQLLAALQDKTTLDENLDLAEQLAGLVASAFPPAAMTAAEVELALEALRLLLAEARTGEALLHVSGGYPDIVGQENSSNFRDR